MTSQLLVNWKNCLAICDVSGSMDGTPMDASVALGLLISELSEEPWKGKLITFSHDPQLQVIQIREILFGPRLILWNKWIGK